MKLELDFFEAQLVETETPRLQLACLVSDFDDTLADTDTTSMLINQTTEGQVLVGGWLSYVDMLVGVRISGKMYCMLLSHVCVRTIAYLKSPPRSLSLQHNHH